METCSNPKIFSYMNTKKYLIEGMDSWKANPHQGSLNIAIPIMANNISFS